MVNETTVSSNALVLLGGPPIASFDEGTTQSDIAKQLFESTYLALLTETRWHFATRYHKLSKLYDKPTNGYENKFQLPEDCLYVIKCTHNPYEIYQDDLYTDAEDAQIEYVFRPDVNKLPAYFVKALEYSLASQFAIPLSSDNARAQLFDGMALGQLKLARFNDASSRTNTKIEDSPYITARF